MTDRTSDSQNRNWTGRSAIQIYMSFQVIVALPRIIAASTALLTFACAANSPSLVYGQLSDFVIDPSQSYITLAGTIIDDVPGEPLLEQFPGSLTTQLSGDVFANVSDFSAVTFNPLSSIQLATQPGLATPAGVIHQFAAESNIGAETIFVVAYGIVISTPAATTQAVGGILDTTKIDFNFISGTSEISPTLTFEVIANSQNTAGPGSLQLTPEGTRMVIPIHFTGMGFETRLDFTGQIVAVASVPEPSTLILAAFGGLALLTLKGRPISCTGAPR